MALLVFRNFAGVQLSWVDFLIAIAYATSVSGLVLVAGAGLYFFHRLRASPADVDPVLP